MSDRPRRNTHPNNAPGVPMIFPPWFEKLQIKYINPVIRPLSNLKMEMRLPGRPSSSTRRWCTSRPTGR